MFYRWLSALCVLWLVECFSEAVISWLSPVSFSPRWWIRELAFISHCWPDKDLVLIAGWKSRFVKHGWFTEADNSSTGQQWSPEGWGREIDRGKKKSKRNTLTYTLFSHRKIGGWQIAPQMRTCEYHILVCLNAHTHVHKQYGAISKLVTISTWQNFHAFIKSSQRTGSYLLSPQFHKNRNFPD